MSKRSSRIQGEQSLGTPFNNADLRILSGDTPPSATGSRRIMQRKPVEDGKHRPFEMDERTVLDNIARFGTTAVIGIDEGRIQIDPFIDRFVGVVEEVGGAVLKLEASGHIHGEPLDEVDAQVTHAAISQIRRPEDRTIVVVMFQGVDYDAISTEERVEGTPDIKIRVADLIKQQFDMQNHSRRGQDRPPILEGLGFLAIGAGEPRHMLTHEGHFSRPEGAALALLTNATSFGLSVSGNLHTNYANLM